MGHVFVNPVDENAYMAMLWYFALIIGIWNNYYIFLEPVCSYKNGSFAREKVRESCASGQWEEFDRLLDSTQPGNDGNIGM